MTRWKFPNGDVVDQRELPDYLDNRFPGNRLYEMFEDEFNAQNNAAVILYDYGGQDTYHDVFRSWIEDHLEYVPSVISDVVGMTPVSGSASVRGSKGAGSKATPKSASTKRKTPARKPATRGRC